MLVVKTDVRDATGVIGHFNEERFESLAEITEFFEKETVVFLVNKIWKTYKMNNVRHRLKFGEDALAFQAIKTR